MRDEKITTQRLLVLRKLTRSIADLLRNQLKDYLVTLTPLLRPISVLGEYVQSSSRLTARGADRAFKDLQSLYETAASRKPFEISRELKPPVEILSSSPEIAPIEYAHLAGAGSDSKTVTVTSPFRWVLTYSGFGLPKLRELIGSRSTTGRELAEFLLHTLVMRTVLLHQPGLLDMLSALHFPVSWEQLPEFGEMPITCISSTISTFRPPDPVIIESTEISGVDIFEEVVQVSDITKISEPFKDRLVELARSHGEELPGLP